MSKHTPAPWIVEEAYREGFSITAEDNYVVICTDDEGRYGSILFKEDANLIAAAPELLEALEALLNEPTNSPDYLPTRLWDRAREAVAKAKGE